MKIILKLSLIVVLLNHAESHSHARCVHFENDDLSIPEDNSIVKGEKKENNTWYQHVNWLDTPAGDLTLSSKMEYWAKDDWHEFKEAKLDLFSEGNTEWHGLADFVKKALGLNNFVKIPGKVRVPATLFTDKKCFQIRFGRYYMEDLKYRVSLNVVDDDDNKILRGRVIIPSKGEIFA